MTDRPLYHLALRDEWEEAQRQGEYRRSTLGKSLDEVGFIHCSFAEQVRTIADLFYRGRTDVVLLVIDPARLRVHVRAEKADGVDSWFPNIYGPLALDAVVSCHQLLVDHDGRLVLNDEQR